MRRSFKVLNAFDPLRAHGLGEDISLLQKIVFTQYNEEDFKLSITVDSNVMLVTPWRQKPLWHHFR